MDKSGFMDFSNLEQAWKCAKIISKSVEFCPKFYRENPEKVLCAIQYGMEIGLSSMQALWGIKIMNGVPTVPGEVCLALCLASGQVENMKQSFNESKTEATFCMKRKGMDELSYTYTKEDAVRAQLWGKKIIKEGRELPSPWVTNPDVMLMWRAKGFVMKALFSDILKGVVAQEEAQDYVEFDSHEKDDKPEPEKDHISKNDVIKKPQPQNKQPEPPLPKPEKEKMDVKTEQVVYENKSDESADKIQKRVELENKLYDYISYYEISDETVEKWKNHFCVETLGDLSDNDLSRLVNTIVERL